MPDEQFQWSDFGVGVDSSDIAQTAADSGVGADIILMGLWFDAGYFNDFNLFNVNPVTWEAYLSLTVDFSGADALADAGTGIDSISEMGQDVFDAGVGTDVALQSYDFTVTDSGTGSDLAGYAVIDIGVGMDHGTTYAYDSFKKTLVSPSPIIERIMNVGIGWNVIGTGTWAFYQNHAFGNYGLAVTFLGWTDGFQVLVDVPIDTDAVVVSSSSSSSSSSQAVIQYQQGFALCCDETGNSYYRCVLDTLSHILIISKVIGGEETILASTPFVVGSGFVRLLAVKNGTSITFSALHSSDNSLTSVTATDAHPLTGQWVGLSTTLFTDTPMQGPFGVIQWPLYDEFRCWSLVGSGPAVARSSTPIESGTGTDFVGLYFTVTDSAMATITATLEAALTLVDVGHGKDLTFFFFADAGVGTDSISQLLITVTDAGVGVDVIGMGRTVVDTGHGIDNGASYIYDIFAEGSELTLPSHQMNIGSGWIILGGTWYALGGYAFGDSSMVVTKAVPDNFQILCDVLVDTAAVSSSSSSSSSSPAVSIQYQQGLSFCVSDLNNGYLAYIDTLSRILAISKIVNGDEAILASSAFTLGSGVISLSLVKKGTAITFTAVHPSDGMSVTLTATDASPLSGLFVGMTTTLFLLDTNPADWPKFANFRCWNLIGSGVQVSYAPSFTDSVVGNDIALQNFLYADTGAGVDSVGLFFPLRDSGVGVDSIADRTSIYFDAGMGTMVILAFDRELSDAGVGAEVMNMDRPQPEAGVGADSVSISILIVVSDSGVGVDSWPFPTNDIAWNDLGNPRDASGEFRKHTTATGTDIIDLDVDVGILEDSGIGQEYFIAAPGRTAYPFGQSFEPGER